MKGVVLFPFALVAWAEVSMAQADRPRTVASPDISAFIERLDSLRKDARIPGLSVAVVKDKSLVLALGLGYADFEKRIPATAKTPYDIASVAKPLSAVVALRLVEAGVLDLDRPMATATGRISATVSASSSRAMTDLSLISLL